MAAVLATALMAGRQTRPGSPLHPSRIAAAIQAAARRARTEEDLRIGVEEALRPVREALGISPRYERTYPATVAVVGGGSSDAVYGHAIIEYKKPGVLSNKRGIDEAIWGRPDARKRRRGGLVQYMRAEAERYPGDESNALHRIIGVGTDGERIVFVRYRGEEAESIEAGPAPRAQLALFDLPPVARDFKIDAFLINEESVDLLLLYLRALRRRPLTPEALADEFGPKGDIARQLVSVLYGQLTDAVNRKVPKVATFFAEWDRLFGIVYGQDLSRGARDVQELSRLYGLTGKEKLKPLLFAVHTYYALLMKLLAVELASLQTGSLVASIVTELSALGASELRHRLEEIEEGGLFTHLGIRNFLEGDFFSWYLATWKPEIGRAIREMSRVLSEYEPATGSLKPEVTRDLLKKLYQYLIPRELRHDLGEYYTPDWLAELVLDEVGYHGDPKARLLDPACGSGTFLVLAIRRALRRAGEQVADPGDTARSIVANVVGFDLNPLAVIAARTNYLLALGNLIRHVAPLEIPVYLCDSILTPAQAATVRPLEHANDVPVPSVVDTFWIPEDLVKRELVTNLTSLLEECVRREYDENDFIRRCKKSLGQLSAVSEQSLGTLYAKILKLEDEGRNGIWARILKNAFAPLFAGRFEFVAGNPPWVNWESLSTEYREATKDMWSRYGLFSLKGHAARLGGGKKDVSMLMLYASADSYLTDSGKLAFVITQTVFKTKGAGDGFRRFRIGDAGPRLGVTSVHDLSTIQPFEGASNRTATISLQKGRNTEYPVSYTVWRKKPKGNVEVESSLERVVDATSRQLLSANPVNSAKPTSPWLTSSVPADDLRGALRSSAYKAHAGVCTWLNGVYWIEVLELRPDGLLLVSNFTAGGKTDVPTHKALVEPDIVYPLLRGQDIARWRATPSKYILMVQDPVKRKGYDESWLRVEYPRTYSYLKKFEGLLRNRSGFRKFFEPSDPFYSIYDVAEYTFAPWQVMWRQMVGPLRASVVGPQNDRFLGKRTPVTQHVVTITSFPDMEEAHYFCALSNSTAASFIAVSYSTSKSYGTPSVLDHVAIPKYDPRDRQHRRLSELSQIAHTLAAHGEDDGLEDTEREIDSTAAAIWGLSQENLSKMKLTLRDQGWR